VARQLQSAVVSVGPGTYELRATLEFDASDSGIQWIADASPGPGPAAAFSGGSTLGPWQPTTSGLAGLQLVEAKLPDSGTQDRHLYINQRRATRTRLSGDAFSKLFLAAKIDDIGFALDAKAVLPAWQRAGLGAELVFPQSTSPWTEPRCAVLESEEGRLNIMQPCWHNLRHKACGQIAKGNPGYIENVGPAFIAQQGEWAINHTSKMVMYALRDGETAASIQAIMPNLEVLVNVTGSHGVGFSGLLFEHATWLRPGQADGYVEQQTGCCAVGTNPGGCTSSTDKYWSIKSPGNIVVQDSSNVSFSGCEFSRLGGTGLDFTRSTGCLVDRCFVHDVSGSGIQIGSFDEPNVADETLDNTVRDTTVTQAAVEYSGAAGINVGYTQGTVLEHNEVSNLTYVGITVGWGWSRHACWNCTNAGWNTIRYNKIHDYKKTLNDGGGIYMLGPQNGSLIHDNYVYNQGTASSGALYPDEGSAYSTWYSNVVSNIGKSEWLHLWTSSIHNITVRDNYMDTAVHENAGTNCPMINNTLFPSGKPPAEAQAIMSASGVRNKPRLAWLTRGNGVCGPTTCNTTSLKCPGCCDDCGLPNHPSCNSACNYCAWC